MLAVIRPNLPPKPHTLIVPKVTIKNMEDTGKIFGPAQAAVAKAIADSAEEGIIPADKLDEWVIICSVFIHPKATDYRKIYQYNYGATKMALQRALKNYPSLEKIIYEKDRCKTPDHGLQSSAPMETTISTDFTRCPSLENAKKILAQLPGSDRIIIEVGTPLIKRYGTRVISDLRTSRQRKIHDCRPKNARCWQSRSRHRV